VSADFERFFFVHLQKTAGTSLVRMLRERFGRQAVYPADADGDPIARVIEVDHLVRCFAARRDEIRVVTGHFPLCTAELLGGNFATFTVLRDPVERTLSYLRHHKKTRPDDADLSLEQVYDDPFRFDGLIHNHMVKMLSLTVDEMTEGALTHVEFTPARLACAKRNLEAIDVVGLQERFDDFSAALERRFGWDLGPTIRINRTEPDEAPVELRRRIMDDNAMDMELYAYAREVCSRRHSAA
jgi:hypothetical protein